MAKPRILVLMHYMELGGAEMALVGLLHALDPDRVDVDLFIYSHQGPLMRYIPQWVNLLPESEAYSAIEKPLKEVVLKRQYGVAIGRILAKIRQKFVSGNQLANDISIFQHVGDCVTPFLPTIEPDMEYDLCISFLLPHNIGKDKVKAKRRLAWIHTDYSTVHVNAKRELPVWGAYDYIASISKEVTRSFLSQFPSLEPKIIEIENILSTDYVCSHADAPEEMVEFGGGINLLSVGRFTAAKNYDNVPDICLRIRSLGIDVKWYIIGYGSDEELIRSKIDEAGMQEHVILLGKKENPYPYIKACDIYVQPSRYEGKSVTVREAQILCKPVVVTNYTTASSQINNGVDGVIVPMDNEGCARGIADFIANEALRTRIADHLRTHDYSHAGEVDKIYKLM